MKTLVLIATLNERIDDTGRGLLSKTYTITYISRYIINRQEREAEFGIEMGK
jgi:hypothetical protein